MAARYLNRKTGRGMVSPYVEVEICGSEFDSAKVKTKTVNDNGFNPYWDDTFDFQIVNPDLALLRFVVYDVDIFGDSNFIGQYTVPVKCIRSGYRSIPLKNAFSEDLELSGIQLGRYNNCKQMHTHTFYFSYSPFGKVANHRKIKNPWPKTYPIVEKCSRFAKGI